MSPSFARLLHKWDQKRYSMIIQNLTYPALMAALTKYTKRFIHFLLQGAENEDFLHCKKTLELLLTELRRRKKESYNSEEEVPDSMKYVLDTIQNNRGILN
jgi:hypothetical protein